MMMGYYSFCPDTDVEDLADEEIVNGTVGDGEGSEIEMHRASKENLSIVQYYFAYLSQ
jgi:hypothetical protein